MEKTEVTAGLDTPTSSSNRFLERLATNITEDPVGFAGNAVKLIGLFELGHSLGTVITEHGVVTAEAVSAATVAAAAVLVGGGVDIVSAAARRKQSRR